jgi:hypothetical protein
MDLRAWIVAALPLGVFSIILGGCASTSEPVRWIGGKGDVQTFKRDSWECSRDSRAYGPSWGDNPFLARRTEKLVARSFYTCMEGHGYTATCPDGMHFNDDRDKCKPD